MKVNTVNVILYHTGTIQVVHSYKDDDLGNKQAERLFRKYLRTKETSQTEIELSLDDGLWEDPNSDFRLFLTHSS